MSWDVLVSPLLDLIKHLTRSKVSLEIKKLWMYPHTYEEIEGCEDIEGFTGYVMVTNKGKKIAYNVTAEISVDDGWAYVEVLETKLNEILWKTFTFDKRYSQRTCKLDYKWVSEKKNSHGSVFNKLRQDDFVFLSFPRGHKMHANWSAVHSRSLYITRGNEHHVTITVKAEDSEKNTVSASRTFKFVIPQDFLGSLFIP